MPSRVSEFGVVAVTSRFAASWNTRARWSCSGFICGLTRTASSSDEVIVNGFQASERHDDWSDGSAWPDLHIRGEYWGRRRSRGSDDGLACGHEQLQCVESADAAQRLGAVEHLKAGNREECASG